MTDAGSQWWYSDGRLVTRDEAIKLWLRNTPGIPGRGVGYQKWCGFLGPRPWVREAFGIGAADLAAAPGASTSDVEVLKSFVGLLELYPRPLEVCTINLRLQVFAEYRAAGPFKLTELYRRRYNAALTPVQTRIREAVRPHLRTQSEADRIAVDGQVPEDVVEAARARAAEVIELLAIDAERAGDQEDADALRLMLAASGRRIEATMTEAEARAKYETLLADEYAQIVRMGSREVIGGRGYTYDDLLVPIYENMIKALAKMESIGRPGTYHRGMLEQRIRSRVKNQIRDYGSPGNRRDWEDVPSSLLLSKTVLSTLKAARIHLLGEKNLDAAVAELAASQDPWSHLAAQLLIDQPEPEDHRRWLAEHRPADHDQLDLEKVFNLFRILITEAINHVAEEADWELP